MISPERTIGGRYRVLDSLGEGGTGRVWLVEDLRRPGVHLALKEVAGTGAEHARSLRREFTALGGLRHPNLVEVRDLETDDESIRLTMEYVDGVDLVSTTRHEGPSFLLGAMVETLRALAFLHDFGWVHRDLKPANLLVRRRPRLGARVVLLDFGLALRSEDAGTVAGPAGTLPYLAPELFDGAPPDARSDLYALGAVAFEAIHGRPPLSPEGRDLTRFVEAVRAGRRSRPPVPSGYPDGLASWIEELLAPDREERPVEATEALARLASACGLPLASETPIDRAARIGSGRPVGREREIAALHEAVSRGTGPCLVWLCGGAGEGKTRVLRWLVGELAAADWTVISDPPELDPALGGDVETSVGSLLDTLRSRASREPVVVLLDEVEYAGARAARFLERVAREGREAPLRVVAAVRPSELRHPDLRDLLAQAAVVPTIERVDLDRWSDAAVRALAERATGRAVSDARARWLERYAEGNALRAASLLVDGAWERGSETEGPTILDRSVDARTSLLGADARAWLEALCVIRDGAPDVVVAALAGLDVPAASAAAGDVKAAGLAREVGNRWHPESRAAAERIVAGLDPERSQAMHALAARTLESRGHADIWGLARLWAGAGKTRAAATLAERAGLASLDGGDPLGAAERFRAALAWTPGRDRRHSTTWIRLGDALARAGRYAGAARAFGAARRGRLEGPHTVTCAVRQAHALARAGRLDRARKLGEASLARAETLGLSIDAARARQAIGIAVSRAGRTHDAVPLFERSLDVMRLEGTDEDRAEALQLLAISLSRIHDPRAVAAHTEALTLHRKLGDVEAEIRGRIGLANQWIKQGDYASAIDSLETARTLSRDHGQSTLAVYSMHRLANVYQEEGRVDRAITLAAEAAELAQYLGDRGLLHIVQTLQASTLLQCNRNAEAIAQIERLASSDDSRIEPQQHVYVLTCLATALLEQNGPHDDSLLSILDEAFSRANSLESGRARLAAWEAELERRLHVACEDGVEEIIDAFDDAFARYGHELDASSRLHLTVLRAAVDERLNRPDAAVGRLPDLGQEERDRFPWVAARYLGLQARCLRAMGRSAESVRLAELASSCLDEAASRIEDPSLRRDLLAHRVARELRSTIGVQGESADSRVTALYAMVGMLNSETDPEQLLRTALDLAIQAVSAERGMILLHGDRGEIRVRLSRGLARDAERDVEAVSRKVLDDVESEGALLVTDAGKDPRYRHRDSVARYKIRSVLCVPLRSRGRTVGVVYVDTREHGVMFSGEDLRFLEAFADHAALALENSRERTQLEWRNRQLRSAAGSRDRFDDLIGRSPPMLALYDLIERVAPSELPVLISGESGTGKELVARAIHRHSARRGANLLTENCAAIPDSLLEAELFGHVRGAFTGADRDRPGLFEQADGGTLLLDEVGDMSPDMQARLLRVLEDGEVRRVGGERAARVDVRVLAATHRDLEQLVSSGRFREDLLYRLRVIVIRVPGLRERGSDIGLLVRHFLDRVSRERGRPAPEIERDLIDVLERYPWPGNVRQLESAVQRLALLAGDGPVSLKTVEADSELRRTLLDESYAPPTLSLAGSEREQIRRALEACEGNRNRAARLLGISRATIFRKMRTHGLR